MLFTYLQYFLFFIFCLVGQFVNAKNPLYFKHLTVEEGLSNSSVLSVMQDTKGFIWLGTRDGLNRYDGKRVTVYKDFFSKNPKGANVKLNCVVEDERGNLLIGTNNGLYHYDIRKDVFTLGIKNYITTIFKDQEKRIWIGSTEGFYLFREFKENNLSLTYVVYAGLGSSAFTNVQTIAEDKAGQLILGTGDGLFLLKISDSGVISVKRDNLLKGINVITLCRDSVQNIWAGSNKSGLFKIGPDFAEIDNYTSASLQKNILDNNVRRVIADSKGNVWIGTLKGLNRYDAAQNKFDSWTHDQAKYNSLNYNSIYDIYEDRQGSIWVGTYYGGANIIEAYNTNFTIYQNEPEPNSLGSNIISSIIANIRGNLWVGTEAEGLNLIDFKHNLISRFNIANKKLQTSNLIKALYSDHAKTLWVGSFNGGISFFNNSSNIFTRFSAGNGILNSENVTAIVEDEQNQLWIGHQDYGINIIDKDRVGIYKIEDVFPAAKIDDEGITFLYKSANNNMFIGTRSGAFISEYTPDNKKKIIRKFFPLTSQKVYINSITEDSLHRIWIGSSAGLVCFKESDVAPVIYSKKNGLPSDNVVGVIPESKNVFWISTNKGLSKLDLLDNQFINYNKHDGLPSGVFNYHSFYKHPDGRIFFGSINGLVGFLPSQIQVNPDKPSVELTSLTVNGESVKPGDKTKILKESIISGQEINLRYDQSDVGVDYAVLNFVKPEKNMSAYKLNGYNNNWVNSSSHKAVFTRLQPGLYTLYIKAANNDGFWHTPVQVLTLRVSPPFWLTWWAYVIYILATITVISGVFYFLNSRAALKRELIFEHELNKQQRELEKMKTDFFTHMSHELRTPLTLILGPTEMLLEKVEKKRDEKMLVSIKTNAERMLNLTNSLMTFMKADSGALKLNLKSESLVPFVRSIFDNFEIQAHNKNIQYSFIDNVGSVIVKFDRHYLEIVITNLLSNAIKFTPSGGEVRLGIEKNNRMVDVSICDNGVGINEEDAQKIFTQFFQASSNQNKNEGSGVGLALSKKLMLLHNGELFFSSLKYGGNNKTCFTLSLKEVTSSQGLAKDV